MKNLVIFCTLLALAMVQTACHHEAHHKKEEPTLPVSKAVRKDTTIFKEYVCQIRSIQHIELRALEKGYLQNVFVDEGKFVRKGQVLFQIMPLVYQAEAKKAVAEAKFAEIELQNTKNLAEKNIVSANELSLAQAKYEKAKAELALAQTHLGFTQIRAPFDGIVGRFMVRLGSMLDEGELLTTLSDNSKTWVYFNVPESEYLDFVLQKNKNQLDSVQLVLANNRLYPYKGFVETIEADFNNETGNIAFRATFNNPDNILRHGETGNILMPVKLQKALLIPQKATFEVLEKKFVYVVDKSNIVRAREIKVAQEMPHAFAIAEGLQEGDRVLLEGLRKVKDGQHIKTKLVDFDEVMNEMKHIHAE
ncbi:MAG: efflux RND transporter periplasmic adaptor subunit [Raineya sp.]